MANCPTDSSRVIFRYGFYFSLLCYFYGTLFPFGFDFSTREVAKAMRYIMLLPYWDMARGRITGVPDSIANILLTLPLGFLGFLHRSGNGRISRIWTWGALGLALGLTVETLQLAIPSRTSSVTDILNNGVGALAGAALARVVGSHLRRFSAEATFDHEYTYFWLLTGVLFVFVLAPFDFTFDVSQIIGDLKSLLRNPWELGTPVGDGWLQVAGFALVGGLAGRIASTRGFLRLPHAGAMLAIVVLLPLGLEASQFVVSSHAPSLRDLVMEMMGAAGGWAAGFFLPVLARPFPVFVLVNLAIVAVGLSPYDFVSWHQASSFQWTPFLEYYSKTTTGALSDAIMGFVAFGLAAGLLQLSCEECPRWLAAGYTIALAAGIEIAQLFIPSRYANVTDVLIAGLGAWVGLQICSGIESSAEANQIRPASAAGAESLRNGQRSYRP